MTLCRRLGWRWALVRIPDVMLLCDSRYYGIAGALRTILMSKAVSLEVRLFSAVVLIEKRRTLWVR